MGYISKVIGSLQDVRLSDVGARAALLSSGRVDVFSRRGDPAPNTFVNRFGVIGDKPFTNTKKEMNSGNIRTSFAYIYKEFQSFIPARTMFDNVKPLSKKSSMSNTSDEGRKLRRLLVPTSYFCRENR